MVALEERDCCVGTDDGLSFHDGSNCSLCVGALDLVLYHVINRGLFTTQFTGSFRLSMM